MENQVGTKKPIWIWVVAIIVIIIVLGAIWYYTQNNKETTAPESTKSSDVYVPKNADWQKYKSSKYGFNISYPIDYVLVEGGDKSINLSKGGVRMVELSATQGDSVTAMVALYTDASKEYMTGGQKQSVTVAGTTGTKISGTFGKNGGLGSTNAGIVGSTIIFLQNGYTYELTSFDKGDATAVKTFNDIASDIQF